MSGITTEAIDKILSMAPIEEKELHGIKYHTKQLYSYKPPTPDFLPVHSLTGIVDYINEVSKGDTVKGLFIHIVSPTLVTLSGALSGDFRTRECYLQSKPTNSPYRFGHTQPHDEFIISILSDFVQDDNTALLMKFLGSIKSESGVTLGDDGVSQSVVANISLGTDAKVNVPNPIKLAPFRTFPEIDQPKSDFVFRLEGNIERGVRCALYEADGEAWKLDAIKRIREWLRSADGMESISIIA